MTWDKQLRLQVFISIYTILFWQETSPDLVEAKKVLEYLNPDWQKEELKEGGLVEKPNGEQLLVILETFLEKEDVFLQELEEVAKDWSKTFLVIKAVLLASCLELFEIEKYKLEIEPKFISFYVRIAEDYAGSKNASLVYALLSRKLGRSPSKEEVKDLLEAGELKASKENSLEKMEKNDLE